MSSGNLLIDWYRNTYRELPWRNTRDPYLIFLSEIILQQTQVQQGLPYYEKFAETYPTVHDLAAADEQDVLKLWQGLGYYSRARNMHSTARYVSRDLKGEFPRTAKGLLTLKGIGPYTAAAIASFAFNAPEMVIDGNVERVVSRFFNISKNIRRSEGKRELTQALASLFTPEEPATFNQSIMELGSQICKPKAPLCGECPLSDGCLSNDLQVQELRPNKGSRTKVKTVQFNYLVVLQDGKTYIEKRSSGLWKNMYQFPLIEGTPARVDLLNLSRKIFHTNGRLDIKDHYETTHLLSHRKINAHFYTITSSAPIKSTKSTIFEIGLSELDDKYPIATLIDRFLQEKLTNGK